MESRNSLFDTFLTEKERYSQMTCTDDGDSTGQTTHSNEIDDDSDTETNLDVTETRIPFDDTGQRAYENACKKYGALPANLFHRNLATSSTINLKHYGIGPKGACAISIPMVINTRVTSLNLQSNDLGISGLNNICRMMSENTYITDLNLSDNNLRTQGAKLIAQMLYDNQTLRKLEISGNNFTDEDAKILSIAVEEHPQLRILDLSKNNFGSAAGTTFKRMIGENGILQELNLSWNNIRAKGAIDVAGGIKENIGLKYIDVSWNGFGNEGATAMAIALKANGTLAELDLTSTRVKGEGFISLCKAFKDNDTLKVLRVGKNSIGEQEVLAGLELIKKLEDPGIETLDLSDVICSKRVGDKLEEMRESHEHFTCIYGYTDSYGKRKLKTLSVVEEAMQFLVEYAEEQNIKLVELFERFDDDGSMSVTHEEFKEGLKEAKIPLTEYQIEQLILALDKDGDGEIDFSEFILGAEETVLRK